MFLSQLVLDKEWCPWPVCLLLVFAPILPPVIALRIGSEPARPLPQIIISTVLDCLGGRDLPMFDNLIDLEMDFCHCCHLSVLPNLLHRTPNLQILILTRSVLILGNSRIVETSSLILPKWVPN